MTWVLYGSIWVKMIRCKYETWLCWGPVGVMIDHFCSWHQGLMQFCVCVCVFCWGCGLDPILNHQYAHWYSLKLYVNIIQKSVFGRKLGHSEETQSRRGMNVQSSHRKVPVSHQIQTQNLLAVRPQHLVATVMPYNAKKPNKNTEMDLESSMLQSS